MAWQKDTIKLGAAQKIFSQFNVREIIVAGKVAGYQADIAGGILQHTSLTSLCGCIVDVLVAGERNFQNAAEADARSNSVGSAVDNMLLQRGN